MNKNNNNGQLGLITEVGDLGLGFDPLSEKDKNKINLETNKDNNKEER